MIQRNSETQRKIWGGTVAGPSQETTSMVQTIVEDAGIAKARGEAEVAKLEAQVVIWKAYGMFVTWLAVCFALPVLVAAIKLAQVIWWGLWP